MLLKKCFKEMNNLKNSKKSKNILTIAKRSDILQKSSESDKIKENKLKNKKTC